jgi:lipopolysaccharide export system permease protein
VALILPRYTFELFPIATLLGSMIGLGSLASHSELIAMRAAGVSVARILGAVLKTGFLLLLLVLFIGEYLAPRSEQYAQRMKLEALSDQVSLKTRHGFWSRNGKSFINVRQILPDGRLADVYIYDYDDQRRLQRILRAQTAFYRDEQWELQGVRETRFSSDRVTAERHHQLDWHSLLEPTVLDVVAVKPQMLPAWDLWRYVEFLKSNGQDASTFEVAFWSKLASPLVTLVMLFLSIPFVFGPLRSVGIGQRVFTGAIIGILFYLLNRTFSYLAVVYGLTPLVASALPAMLFFGFAFWSFRRLR